MRRLVLAVPLLALAAGCTSTASGSVKTAPNAPAATSAGPAAAPVTTTPAAKPKPAAKVGDGITVNGSKAGDQLTITVVKIVDPASSDNQFSTPRDGSRYVAVQFRIKNTGTGGYADDPDIDVAAIDGSGQQYDVSIGTTVTAGAKLNSSVNVAAGDTALGFEVFEVPKGQKLAKVQYKLNMGLGGDVAQWTVG